jgi:hypothetical protein
MPYLFGARGCHESSMVSNRDIRKNQNFEEHFPLFTRGWVIQERMLSRRMLYCHREEFRFQCLEANYCECNGMSPPHPKGTFPGGFKINPEIRLDLLREKGSDKSNIALRWMEMVHNFCLLKLTNQTDILPAIGGCAKAIARWTGEEYIAGMWKEHLHRNLLWMNYGLNKQSTKPARHTEWTAPTWSWASLPCGQRINFFPIRQSFRKTRSRNYLYGSIIEVVCQKDGPDAFGKIKSGHLKIVTELLPCKLRRYCATIFDGVNTQATNRRFDLHCSKRTNELRCQTPDVGLDVNEAAVDVWLDYNVWNDLSFD